MKIPINFRVIIFKETIKNAPILTAKITRRLSLSVNHRKTIKVELWLKVDGERAEKLLPQTLEIAKVVDGVVTPVKTMTLDTIYK